MSLSSHLHLPRWYYLQSAALVCVVILELKLDCLMHHSPRAGPRTRQHVAMCGKHAGTEGGHCHPHPGAPMALTQDACVPGGPRGHRMCPSTRGPGDSQHGNLLSFKILFLFFKA